MELVSIFSVLGLPKHSAAIYEVVEKKGPSSVSAIATATRVHRPAVYRALAALTDASLMYEKKFGKRMLYAAHSRSRIKSTFSRFTRSIETLTEAEPERGLQNSLIRYFEGEQGIGAVFNDVVSHASRGDTFFRYTSERDLDGVNKLLPSDYRTRRDNKRLERLVISNPESGRRKRSRLERFIKFLGTGKESFDHNAIQLIYGKRIAFIDLNTKESFIIENETLAEFQKTIFKALYARL